jgi:hypothetical protein
MDTISLRAGFLPLLLLAALIGCAGNSQHHPNDSIERSTRFNNLKRAVQLPWSDDGSCAVREASNEWGVLVERCFYALDFQKIRFEASPGKCAKHSENLTALGICLLAAVPVLETSEALERISRPLIASYPMTTVAFAPALPVVLVAGVVIVGAVSAGYLIGNAIKELVDHYQETRPARLANPEQVKPQPQAETRPKPEVVVDGSPDPEPKPEPSPKGRIGPDVAPLPTSPETKKREKKLGRTYVTYWKLNVKENRRYTGRTSMVAELDFARCEDMETVAQEAIRQRDKNHHVEEQEPEPKDPGFLLAEYDKHDCGKAVDYKLKRGDLAYWRIRGREQMLIDAFGGARSDTGKPYKTENRIRGVAKDNEDGRKFYNAAVARWGNMIYGEKVEYTGKY